MLLVNGKQRIYKAMNPLDEYLEMTPAMRRIRLGQFAMQDAIKGLGTEPGIAWLETHIESPVGKDWGRALFALKPSWRHLDRWIRLSKLHCLAAIDALFFCADPDGGENCQIPEGADPQSINEAVDFALAHYDNPRLEDAAREIRYAWPKGCRKRHNINVPTSLLDAADVILCNEANLMIDWRETMATAQEAASTPFAIWESLLAFAQAKDLVGIVDRKEWSENIVASLRALKPARRLEIVWDAFVSFDGDTETLLRAVNGKIAKQGSTLVSLDHGCDDYPLTFIPAKCVPRLAALISSFCDEAMRVIMFTAEK